MSEDWLVRGQRFVEITDVIQALDAVAPDLRLRADEAATAVVVVDPSDRPVVWVNQSRAVEGPEGTGRLFPLETADQHAVWTEVTGPTDVVTDPFDSPHALIRAVAEGLAGATDGVAVRLSASSLPGADEPESAQDGSVEPPPAAALGEDASASSGRRDVPVDIVTGSLAILVQSRPVLALTPWVAHCEEWARAHDLRLVLLTPAATVLTPGLFLHLQASDATWVVDSGTGMFLGLTGHRLGWDGADFVVQDELDEGFVPSTDDVWSLYIQAETTLPYADATVVGEFTASVARAAGLDAPTAVGVLDPPEEAWSPAIVTEFARTISPNPSRLVVATPDADGVIELMPQPVGLVERVTLIADAGDEPPTQERADAFLHGLAAAGGQVALLGVRRATRDRLVPARFTGPTVPKAVLFSRSRFPTLGDEEALRLLGDGGELRDEPHPAAVVTYDLSPDVPTDEEHNPVVRWLELVDAVAHHDGHAHAAAAARAAEG